ncbi:MAG: PAAR domain-containing protein [Coriobacteriia bacterium]|nr:PAAR domain-containing protein [Coriobacteriia bacterium]
MSSSTTRRVLRAVLITILLSSTLMLYGCDSWFSEDIFSYLERTLDEWAEMGDEEEEAVTDGDVELALTMPVGASPTVFTTGWAFGARAQITSESGDIRDISHLVEWSGSASFSPSQGDYTQPTFNGPGMNTIKISVEVDGMTYTQEFDVNCVNPDGYACVGDQSMCPSCSHGNPCCPHATIGPITTGSPNVYIRGRPAARVGDTGVAAACCGPNTFEITSGDSSVLINGRPAATIGSTTQHCGGVGSIVGGS